MILPRPVVMGGIRKQDQKQDWSRNRAVTAPGTGTVGWNRSSGGRNRNSSVGYIRNSSSSSRGRNSSSSSRGRNMAGGGIESDV
jgi:hypothetical protein